jgi:hypothetical protein
MTKKPSPLQAARTRVATELGLPEDDWRVIRLAALQVAYDGVQATLATGNPRDADVDALLKLDMQIEAVRKEAGLSVKPLAIKVTYVSPNTRCPKCDHAFNLDLPTDDDNGSKVQAANAKPIEPADQTPPKAPGSIVAAVPGAAAMSRPQVIDLEQQRADRSLQLRDEALTNNHFALKRNHPSIGAPFSDNESPVSLSRRIDAAYR